MRRHGWLTGILAGGSFGALVGCGSSGVSVTADSGGVDAPGTPVDASDAGAKGSGERGDVSVDAPACDPLRGPATSSCAVDEAHGVFVSPSGSDVTGAGTRSAPFGSLGQGITAAKKAAKVVYACAGTYAESVLLDHAHDGVSVFGGLDCASWTYATANRVIVAPSQPGYALEVSNLTVGATLSDLEFDAKDADPTQAGESSVAAFVHTAEHVTLVRVTLKAGQGTAGATGASAGGTGPSNWSKSPLDGTPASLSVGAAASVFCTCPLDTAHGSRGGQGGGAPRQDPLPGLPSYGDDAGAGAAGVNGMQCGQSGGGYDGLSGPSPALDPPRASLGTVSESGWSPTSGPTGPFGLVGQGGGGGGDGAADGGLGGSGGCGGCGGSGGQGGGGGGGSIALLVNNSGVSLLSIGALTTSTAGAGGAGGSGEPGQAAGYFGNGLGAGCPGGNGGAGSGGNGGQGGAGGVSLGIAFHGPAPTLDGVAASPASTTYPGVTVSSTRAPGGTGGTKGGAAVIAGTAWPGASPGHDGAAGSAGASQAFLSF